MRRGRGAGVRGHGWGANRSLVASWLHRWALWKNPDLNVLELRSEVGHGGNSNSRTVIIDPHTFFGQKHRPEESWNTHHISSATTLIVLALTVIFRQLSVTRSVVGRTVPVITVITGRNEPTNG